MLGFSTQIRNLKSLAREVLVKTPLQCWLSVGSFLLSRINPVDSYRRFQGCSLVAATVMMLFEGPARVCICFSKSFLKISMILLIISLIFKGFAEWVFFSFCGIFFLHSLKCLTSKSC